MSGQSQLLQGAIRKVLLVFALLTAATLIFKDKMEAAGVSAMVLLAANVILFALSLINIKRSIAAINNTNPHLFVRVFYSGFIIRLFVCGIAAFIYIYTAAGNINKVTLFGCMGIYLVYSYLEVFTLKKVLREKKNG